MMRPDKTAKRGGPFRVRQAVRHAKTHGNRLRLIFFWVAEGGASVTPGAQIGAGVYASVWVRSIICYKRTERLCGEIKFSYSVQNTF